MGVDQVDLMGEAEATTYDRCDSPSPSTLEYSSSNTPIGSSTRLQTSFPPTHLGQATDVVMEVVVQSKCDRYLRVWLERRVVEARIAKGRLGSEPSHSHSIIASEVMVLPPGESTAVKAWLPSPPQSTESGLFHDELEDQGQSGIIQLEDERVESEASYQTRLQRACGALGMDWAIGWSFIAPESEQKDAPRGKAWLRDDLAVSDQLSHDAIGCLAPAPLLVSLSAAYFGATESESSTSSRPIVKDLTRLLAHLGGIDNRGGRMEAVEAEVWGVMVGIGEPMEIHVNFLDRGRGGGESKDRDMIFSLDVERLCGDEEEMTDSGDLGAVLLGRVERVRVKVKPGGRKGHRSTLVVNRPGIYRVEVVDVATREGVALTYDAKPLYFWCTHD